MLSAASPPELQSIYPLPTFPDTAGSVTLGVAYGCTADGKYAVGMDYRGVERAVLWDTSDPNPLKWQVVELTQLAQASGNMDIFASLGRGYSVGVNAAGDLVIAGVGADTNGYTRAFIMTASPPFGAVGYPPIVTMFPATPTGYNFTFLSAPTNALGGQNLTNYLEQAPTVAPPSTWTAIASNECSGVTTTLTDPSPSGAQGFYRIHTY